MDLKSRFCPSPTGYVHLGNARTALFSFLTAHQKAGSFLLRIEDTDLLRSRSEYTHALQIDLQWLGCQWDEGPNCDMGNGPYLQSQRTSIYEEYYQQLTNSGLAYPCFCSEMVLEESRRIQRKLGQPPRYEGTCRHLSKAEINEKREKGMPYALRFSVQNDSVIEFDDIVRGRQTFFSRDIGDFIIKKSDGSASFMFCNAIDDSLMGVTIALRGEDHLTNTPRQILILRALNLTVPEYGHLSLIIGNDGSPLSKRNGSRNIQQLREQGFLPLAIVNYLARLGHVYTDRNELMSLDDCAKYFNLKHLVKAAAHYDEQQLLYWQKEAVMRLSFEELRNWVGYSALQYIPTEKIDAFFAIVQPNSLFPVDVQTWAERLFFDKFQYSQETNEILQSAGKTFFDVGLELLQQAPNYETFCDALKNATNLKGKFLFMPLRAVLTHASHGPELRGVFNMLGPEIIKQKFIRARHHVT